MDSGQGVLSLWTRVRFLPGAPINIRMKKHLQNLGFFFLGLYVIGWWWTFKILWDKEPLFQAVIDCTVWPYMWYSVFFT